jgi:hypothetical protein
MTHEPLQPPVAHNVLGTIAGNAKRSGWTNRVLAMTSGAIGAVAGVAPHVLHHVAPIAGAAFFTGVTGSVLFGVLGLALTVPMLLRLRRRFGTWVAPGIALALFVVTFTFSTFVVGPAIRGDDNSTITEEQPADPHGH